MFSERKFVKKIFANGLREVILLSDKDKKVSLVQLRKDSGSRLLMVLVDRSSIFS